MEYTTKLNKIFKLPLKQHKTFQQQPNRVFLYPARIVLLSFITVITIGTLFLMLPQATTAGSLSFVDALFTATSATCVTGLVVLDTGKDFTRFGQIVILILIQIGGLGIMTLSTFFVYLIAGRLSMTEREIVQDTLSQHPIADLARLLKLVFLFTITIEALGWVLLTIRFMQTNSLLEAMYLGLFHSISAFCNAGFSLFSNSFESYHNDIYINVVLSGLIILGGLGFVVIFDLYKNRAALIRGSFVKLSFHTRIVLFITTILIMSGLLIFLGLEYNNSLSNSAFVSKVMASFFQSVTARTAGFNTLNIKTLTNATLFFLIILMFIGASPGSCGGGIKTSTFMVLMASIFARFQMQEDVNIFYRRIPKVIVSRAISVVFFSIFIIGIFNILLLISELSQISHTESRGLFLEYLFEVVSAFGTVGLTTGVTPQLSQLGRVLITLLMFIGRLGPLTISLAVHGKETVSKFKYVQENVLVG